MGACCSEMDKAYPDQHRADGYGPPGGGGYGNGPAPHIHTPAAAGGDFARQQQQGLPQGGGGGGGSGSGGGGNDKFISVVGELPTFEKKPRRGDDETSSQASQGTEISNLSDKVDAAQSKEQKQQAKAVVKDFVKGMVKGRKMNVLAQNGSIKQCTATLSRNLDTFRIKVGGQTRNIELRDIEEIHAGEGLEGIATPLDELCATLMLASEDCITFRMCDINDRDTFVMCLLMFCNNQK
mmetsp:Transcript_133538/g.426855  ORF Transcript_133538/g.426855 Transcript_133538/m.426855 type:complete len:238 (-) Transcript_133538:137-850(-)